MDRRTTGIVIALAGIVAAGVGAAIAASSRKRVLGLAGHGNLGNARTDRMLRDTVTRSEKTTKVYRSDKISIEDRVGILQELTARAVKDPEMAKLARAITGSGGRVTFGTRTITVRGANCRPRDARCEARAIYDWKRANLRYTGDIAPHVLSMADTGGKKVIEAVDLFKTPMKTIEDGGGDCLPLDTLVLVEAVPGELRVVRLEVIRPGDRIMADGELTVVSAAWKTGKKIIMEFSLSNGGTLRCSPDHRVFVQIGSRAEDIHAEHLSVGDVLASPDLPFTRRLGKNPTITSIRTAAAEECMDLTVEAGKFWLPESDVLVHNCDEQAPVGAALAILNGIPAKFVVSSMEKRPGDDGWSHIWDEVFLGPPKNGPAKWAAIDSTLEGDYFGISAPAAARKEFPA